MKALLYFISGIVAVLAINRRQPLSTNVILSATALTFGGLGWAALSDDQLRGGRADDRSISSFDPVQLELGARVEMEHTANPALAREIAMDHLAEDPRYYEKLVAAGL